MEFSRGFFISFGAIVSFLLSASSGASAQDASKFDLERGRIMLHVLKDDLKKNYYDPTYHGIDLELSFKAAEEKLKSAASNGQVFGIIANVLMALNDSHTYFVPPSRAAITEYGWQAQMIGDKCYIVAVKPDSDAEKKGIHPGDQLIAVDDVRLDRQNVWIFHYLYNLLRPQTAVGLAIIKPDGTQQELVVHSKVQQRRRVVDITGSDGGNGVMDLIREEQSENYLRRHRTVEIDDDLFIWKMPEFDLEDEKVDAISDKYRKRKALILDLRGNGGGAEATLLRLVGNLFDHDVKIGDLRARKDARPIVAKSKGKNAFMGKLFVLIDSESGSASELLARVVQLEKRGIVIGDVSGGAVMRAKYFPHHTGIDVIAPYGASITDADLILRDGNSLEHKGVTPDEIRLPTAAELSAQRDPVLAYAASLAGVSMTPEKAGSFFPIEWRK